tara:strand:+ start:409 stop:618 length:210 start_codon:yes stop_codon:yes gene_type:complete
MLMLEHVVCGWKGEWQDIVIEYHLGIKCSGSCPQCGGEFPLMMWNDEDWEPEGEEEADWKANTRDRRRT